MTIPSDDASVKANAASSSDDEVARAAPAAVLPRPGELIDAVTADLAAEDAVGGDGVAGGPTSTNTEARNTTDGRQVPRTRSTTTRFPRLRLQQHGVGAGTFVDTSTGTTYPRLDAIFVKINTVRRLFTDDENDDDQRRLSCWSDHNSRPSSEVPTPNAATCRTCPHSRWTTSEGAKKPPRCGQVVRGVVVVGVPPRLFEVDFAGVSAQPALAFCDAIRHSTLRALYLARVPIEIVTRDRAAGGRFRAVTFGHWTTVGDDEAATLEALFRKVAEYPLLGRLDEKPVGL